MIARNQSLRTALFAIVASTAAAPLAAQDVAEPGVPAAVGPAEVEDSAMPGFEGSALDGDFLSIGGGVGVSPSYSGSDDYVAFPLPIVQGSLGGIGINPRPGGIAFDFIDDASGADTTFSLGVAGKLNRNRATQIKDPVVEAFGELDTAIEVGPTVGVGFTKVLNPYDSLSLNADVLWDVAGAHSGMSVDASVTYFTPVSRGAAVSLSASTSFIDDDYADYYYSVDPTLAPGTPLPAYQADGGMEDFGLTLLGFVDLNGNLLDGGFALFGIVGYSRLVGDAKDTPFTSVVGSADQWIGGVGLGYTF